MIGYEEKGKMTDEKKPAIKELTDELLDQAAGGKGEDSTERCKRCGSRRSPLFGGYCPRCRAELGI